MLDKLKKQIVIWAIFGVLVSFSSCTHASSTVDRSNDSQYLTDSNDSIIHNEKTTIDSTTEGSNKEKQDESISEITPINDIVLGNSKPYYSDPGFSIYDNKGALLSSFNQNRQLILTPTGLVYVQLPESDLSSEKSVQFVYYSFLTRETKELGIIQNMTYMALYDAITIGNQVFVPVSTGSMASHKTESHICCIDFDSSTMKLVDLNDIGATPYSTMTFFKGAIYFVTETDLHSVVWKYSLETDEVLKMAEYTFDPSNMSGEYIRHITSDSSNLYLLRGEMGSDKPARLFIDKVDENINPISTIDITEYIYLNGIDENMRYDELRQPVSHFEVRNGFVYYENFSATRSLIDITEAESGHDAIRVTELSPDTCRAFYSEPDESSFCYYNLDDEKICFFDTYSKKISEYYLAVDGTIIHPNQIHYTSNSKILIEKRPEDGKSYNDARKFYYIDTSYLTECTSD